MNRLRRPSGAIAALAFATCLQVADATTVLHDDRGQDVVVSDNPRRIVTLLPSLTETVCELDACDRLVGVDRFSDWPASVNALPHLGGLDDAQIERIVALKPDL